MIRIFCPQNNFRRGGVPHPKGEAFYPEDHFDKKSMAAIDGETKLAVTKGLKPAGPDMMSVTELQDALKRAKVEYTDSDPRGLLMGRLANAKAAKDGK